MPENDDNARVEGAQTLGLAFVRTMILLNGGAFAILLAYMAGASQDSLIAFSLAGLRLSMHCFLFSIVAILLSLVISYVYTALNFNSPTRRWLDTKVIPANAFFASASLAGFVIGVLTLTQTTSLQ